MRVLIIEDEKPAADRLTRLLLQLDSRMEVVAVLQSIEEALQWFKRNVHPDLVLADIELADGNSFAIFEKVKVDCPIIFTTAYDQHALRAFKVNALDYILKPVKEEELAQALNKALKQLPLAASSATKKEGYQKRLLIKIGEQLRAINVTDISFFHVEDKITFANLLDGKKYPLDENLDELEALLDPANFFRANRQFIISASAVEKMLSYPKARIKLQLKHCESNDIFISSERSAEFKQWLAGV